jgi:YaiO family outer membrane protein
MLALAPAAMAGDYAWQLDSGIQYSSFARVPQESWNQEFLQVTHFFNGRGTAVHGKATRYEQFGVTDAEYELGVDQRFSPSTYGHLYISGSPDPFFRPEWRVEAGGGYRVSQGGIPAWFTLDARHDSYPTLEVTTLNPGVRIEPFDNWSLSGRLITVSQPNASTIYGWDARLDGQIREGLRFYAGYADAPETVAAVTVQTRTVFGGLAYDLSPACTLRFGYARDDRENSYIRNVFDAGITYRF